MTSGQFSSGLDLTYAPSTITTQKPTESELDLLFEAMYDDYIGSQSLYAPRTAPAAQAPQHQPATIAENVPNAMFDENTFVNPFATPSISVAESSSSHYVDPSNMHTFYQPYPLMSFYGLRKHPLEQVKTEAPHSTSFRQGINCRSDGDIAIESMQEELLLQFKRALMNDEENTSFSKQDSSVVRRVNPAKREGIDFKESFRSFC
ncbi:hypothetical protein Tco_0562721 [Tanacetum coccineum]